MNPFNLNMEMYMHYEDCTNGEVGHQCTTCCGPSEFMTDEEYYEFASFNDVYNPDEIVHDQKLLNENDVNAICGMFSRGCVDREVSEGTLIGERLVQAVRNKQIFSSISDNYDYPIFVTTPVIEARAEVLIIECDLPPAGVQHLLGVEYAYAERIFQKLKPGQRYWELD